MFVLPTFAFGVVASPTVPPETFDTATLTDGSNLASNSNIFTFTVQPSASISAGSSITLSGLTGSATTDGSVSLSGAGAVIFGSAGSWTQSTGTLVLTVDSGQTLPTGSDTVVTFTLTNPASGSGVTSVNLSSSRFTTASISGLFLEAQANQYNIPPADQIPPGKSAARSRGKNLTESRGTSSSCKATRYGSNPESSASCRETPPRNPSEFQASGIP